MAVKIIEKGTKETPVYRRTCPECGCVFEYNYSDTIRSGWSGGYQEVKCPQCGYPVAHLNAGGGEDINHPKLID